MPENQSTNEIIMIGDGAVNIVKIRIVWKVSFSLIGR